MKRNYSQFFPLISILLLFSVLSSGQAWSGIFAPSRGIDWGHAGLPSTLPDGETTANPWTPPTRTQCMTSQCNTVAGGMLLPAPSVPPSLLLRWHLCADSGWNIRFERKFENHRQQCNSCGKRRSQLPSSPAEALISVVAPGEEPLLTANPAKGATSITVASPPSAGRVAALEECDDGFSAGSAAGLRIMLALDTNPALAPTGSSAGLGYAA